MLRQLDLRSRRGFFLVVLGAIALLADLVTLGKFVATGDFMATVWSGTWFLSIGLILLLMSIGLWFVGLGGKQEWAKEAASMFGFLYLSLAVLLYAFICYRLLHIGNASDHQETELRWAFWFMFWGAGGLGCASSLKLSDGRFIREASYALGLANLLFVLGVVYKYNFVGFDIVGWDLVAECIAFLIGAALNFVLFVISPSPTAPRSMSVNLDPVPESTSDSPRGGTRTIQDRKNRSVDETLRTDRRNIQEPDGVPAEAVTPEPIGRAADSSRPDEILRSESSEIEREILISGDRMPPARGA